MRYTLLQIFHFLIPSTKGFPLRTKMQLNVEKGDIPSLVDALRMPPIFKCPNGTVCDGTEGLCIVLKRFAYPCRYSDMIPIFGRSVPEISMISNEVIDWIYNTHHHRITQWNHPILDPASLQTYADAIQNRGAALDNCFGFIDGTVRPICRPVMNQRTVYQIPVCCSDSEWINWSSIWSRR